MSRTNVFTNGTNLNGLYRTGHAGNLGYRGYGYGWRNPYYGYHRGWINGYWGGYYPWGFGYGWGYPFGFGFGLGYGLGYGAGWGLSSWLYGSMLYGYGYSPYVNPYYNSYNSSPTTVVVMPYDYSQPINNTLGPPPAEQATDDALALFESAREAFKRTDFESALRQADDALAKTPNDTSLHEFRALCLFATRRFDEAATTLYAVLSVGPGWDWPTLIGLYPNVDVYTNQLRALESYCDANPGSAASRLVLAYHYLAEGHNDAAAHTFRQVIALKPDDSISASLLAKLDAVRQNAPGTVPALTPVPNETTLPAGATISGTWSAHPAPDTSIVLTIEPGGAFAWQVTRKNGSEQFSGTSTFGGGVLTLIQEKGQVLVGRVNWQDPTHMTFRIVGAGPDDPGLSFSR